MRLRLRFSLFKLLVLFTVVAILLSLVGKRFYDSKAQEEAVKALRSDGRSELDTLLLDLACNSVRIFYDFESEHIDGGVEPYMTRAAGSKEEPQPTRFVDWFGLDFCHDIYFVDFQRALTADDVSHLRKMNGLRKLRLYNGGDSRAKVSLAGLVSLEELEVRHQVPELGELRNLKSLSISGAELRAELAKQISQLRSLEKLDLSNVTLGSESYFEEFTPMPSVQKLRLEVGDFPNPSLLRNFPNLVDLRLSASFKIDSLAVSEIGALERLETLSLMPYLDRKNRFGKMHPFALLKSKMPDPELPQIDWQPFSKLKNLKHASLEFNTFSDEGMRQLCSGAKGLEHLAIGGSQVGNKGLDFAEALSMIKDLKLGGTAITKSGLERFKRVRPNCKIHWK